MPGWMALGDSLGPQPAAYHGARYNFPQPIPPCRWPGAEIEFGDGTVIGVRDWIVDAVICGDPDWRKRRYVGKEGPSGELRAEHPEVGTWRTRPA